MSLRGRIKRAGRSNFLNSFFILLFFAWQQFGSIGMSGLAMGLATIASLFGAWSGWVGWRKPRAHKRFEHIKSIKIGSNIALILWFLQAVFQLITAFGESGAIGKVEEKGKIDNDLIMFVVMMIVVVALLWSNSKLLWQARRCFNRMESKGRSRRSSSKRRGSSRSKSRDRATSAAGSKQPAAVATTANPTSGTVVNDGLMPAGAVSSDAGASVWEERLDPTSGHPYYFNKATNESSWTKPDMMT